MTLDEARRVLGLGPEDDPELRFDELVEARDRIAAMVRQAPNATIALRYQDGLVEFDKALTALREEIAGRRGGKVSALVSLAPGAASGQLVVTKRELVPEPPDLPMILKPKEEPQASPPEPPEAKPPVPPPAKTERMAPEPAEREPATVAERGSGARWAAYLLMFVLVGGVGGGWLYFHIEAEKEAQRQVELTFLEGLGAKLLEGRRWSEAEEAYRKMEVLRPGSEVAARGRRSIEAGMEEEQIQFTGYWYGEALAAFDAGRLDDAETAVTRLLEKYPDEKDGQELKVKIEAARLTRIREGWLGRIRETLEEKRWDQTREAISGMRAELPDDAEIAGLEAALEAGIEQQRKDRARALELAASARRRDVGKFDAEALEWLREAVALAPDEAEVRELYEKMASYTRILRVPEDVATLAEALAGARDRDRIVLGAGVFEGGVVVNVAVQIEGAGGGSTTVGNRATMGPAITLGPGATGSTVSGIDFRQEGFDPGVERFPAVLLRGGEVEFSDCTFSDGSGHGLAVIDGGHATALRCKFLGNGWDGLAARGKGSRMTVRECVADRNFGHGFEVWDGAKAMISGSIARHNVGNGILIDSAREGMELSGNQLLGNREYGILLGAGAAGKVTDNVCSDNLLGGLLVRFAAISVQVEGNRLDRNGGPGLILEQGLRPDIYSKNRAAGNRGPQVMPAVSFDGPP